MLWNATGMQQVEFKKELTIYNRRNNIQSHVHALMLPKEAAKVAGGRTMYNRLLAIYTYVYM